MPPSNACRAQYFITILQDEPDTGQRSAKKYHHISDYSGDQLGNTKRVVLITNPFAISGGFLPPQTRIAVATISHHIFFRFVLE